MHKCAARGGHDPRAAIGLLERVRGISPAWIGRSDSAAPKYHQPVSVRIVSGDCKIAVPVDIKMTIGCVHPKLRHRVPFPKIVLVLVKKIIREAVICVGGGWILAEALTLAT